MQRLSASSRRFSRAPLSARIKSKTTDKKEKEKKKKYNTSCKFIPQIVPRLLRVILENH